MLTRSKFHTLVLSLFLGLSLAACSGAEQETPPNISKLTPMPELSTGPDDSLLAPAMMKTVKSLSAPLNSAYDFRRIDLNNDGLKDAVVLMKSPYGYWCEANGCTMMIMKASANGFNYVGKIHPVRSPVYMASTKNNGWNDIIVEISGRWTKTHDVNLAFNGTRYPSRPDRVYDEPYGGGRRYIFR